MGQAPNETEIKMFFILTLAFAIGGLVFGAFANEFLAESVSTGEVEVSSPKSAISAVLGLFSMFIPGLGFVWLPAWFATMLTVLQLFWIYLLYAVAFRPFIPLT